MYGCLMHKVSIAGSSTQSNRKTSLHTQKNETGLCDWYNCGTTRLIGEDRQTNGTTGGIAGLGLTCDSLQNMKRWHSGTEHLQNQTNQQCFRNWPKISRCRALGPENSTFKDNKQFKIQIQITFKLAKPKWVRNLYSRCRKGQWLVNVRPLGASAKKGV